MHYHLMSDFAIRFITKLRIVFFMQLEQFEQVKPTTKKVNASMHQWCYSLKFVTLTSR